MTHEPEPNLPSKASFADPCKEPVADSFEAVEKRFHIALRSSPSSPRWQQWSQAQWQDLLNLCGASILSHMSNPTWRAFVLSESSLFISQREVILLTCGDCPLIHTLQSLLKLVAPTDIAFVSYLRQAELFPAKQRTSGPQDIRLLSQLLPLQGQRDNSATLTEEQPPFSFVYGVQSEQQLSGSLARITPHYQKRGHGLSGKALRACQNAENKDAVQALLQLSTHFPGYQFDDWLFKPMGYSVNGLKGQEYLTLHLTPEDDISYISVEGSEENHIATYGAFLERLFQVNLHGTLLGRAITDARLNAHPA
ncbi:hypothetical protein [Motilimonas pumila]|uniref:Uncharacterized protein n=1 Tax=Motilimonas pumila TaxID=2303987 RepID=A0A418YCS6_9GAMM|nr:hypothetical protein [Motilimonas pumila]RJG42295.1 hypothetical protein D1Z90_13520 [Motilimonas pumila]